MEVRGPSVSDSEMKDHRALTPIRLVKGIVCLLVLVLTAFMMIVYFGFLSAVVLRPFSLRYSRKFASFFFGAWLALWPFLFEKINMTKVVFSGEVVPPRERVLLIANHRTEVDWMYLWDLAWRKGRLGYIKYVLKSSLMKLPIFSWGFHIMEFISVERRWEVDESNMRGKLSSFKDPLEPLWLALFPEGTDFTQQKCIRSKKYAAENGLPVLKNVLLPKIKGFHACVEELRSCLDAVYDVTIGYRPRCPSLSDNVFGINPSEVHMHIRRVALEEIPTSEEQITAWLMNTFQLKDNLLSSFYAHGHFPDQVKEGDLSTLNCLANFVFVIALISTCTYLTLCSSIWFKIYVSFVCYYLTSATYFDVSLVPLRSFLKAVGL